MIKSKIYIKTAIIIAVIAAIFAAVLLPLAPAFAAGNTYVHFSWGDKQESVSVPEGTTFANVTKPAWTNPGYTLKWSLNPNSYEPVADSYAFTGEYTWVFALWQSGSGEEFRTVDYALNGGTLATGAATETVPKNTKYSELNMPTVTRAGYTFRGWSTDQAEYTAPDPDGLVYMNVTLYAFWQATGEEALIIFKLMGGHIPSDPDGESSLALANVPLGCFWSEVPLPEVTRPGYTLKGWARAGVLVTPETQVIPPDGNNNFGVEAVWEQEAGTVNITFDPNGGSLDAMYGYPVAVAAGTSWTLIPKPTPTRAGYTFRGWSTSSSNDSFVSGAVTADTTVYARWRADSGTTPDEVLVIFHPRGGTFDNVTETSLWLERVERGASWAGVTKPAVSRSGYIFQGWGRNGVLLTPETQVIPTEDGNFGVEAIWELASGNAQITFDPNGGSTTGGTNEFAVPLGTAWDAVTKPTARRTGYSFRGWSSSPTSDAWVTGTVADNMTVYARWESIDIKIVLKNNINDTTKTVSGSYDSLKLRYSFDVKFDTVYNLPTDWFTKTFNPELAGIISAIHSGANVTDKVFLEMYTNGAAPYDNNYFDTDLRLESLEYEMSAEWIYNSRAGADEVIGIRFFAKDSDIVAGNNVVTFNYTDEPLAEKESRLDVFWQSETWMYIKWILIAVAAAIALPYIFKFIAWIISAWKD